MTSIRDVQFARPMIGEEEIDSVVGVLRGTVLAHGPKCKSFEEEFASYIGGDVHCVAVSSCMAALHLSYLEMDVGKNDEVIVPALTHVATAHAVEMVGARPVFCDCDETTGNIDLEKMESLITPRTKTISLVHYIGNPCKMDRLTEIAAKHNIKVVEDCAIALGSRYNSTHVGLFGDTGCYSFYPAKHITTGEGGMFITKHGDVADRVRLIRGFGVNRPYQERKIPGHYDVVMAGLNYRMSELQAALGIVQLRKASSMLERRISNFSTLRENLCGVDEVRLIVQDDQNAEASHYCAVIVLNKDIRSKRDDIILQMTESNIGVSIYYPGPVPCMKYYRDKYGYSRDDYPNASVISEGSIALPVGPHLNDDDMVYVADTLKSILRRL
jgi:perosamine synthetase